MAESLFDTDDPVAAEVDRRVRELKRDPEELLRRFDRNGDGVLDAQELRVMRDLLTREVEANALRDPHGEVIGGRYKIIAPIGQGAQGHTFLARDDDSDEFVALKEIDFAGLGNWDAFDTFERESKVLGGLDHPAIPRMREAFRLGDDEDLRLIMVQDFVEGTNLEALLRDGELFDEARLRRYAEQLLEVLSYLHEHSPPVLHRDIKPANVIERPDGLLVLVDFGAAEGHGNMTSVIGTSGYMPPEQLMGRARPASDLYGLGTTMIHLATRKHPSELGDGLDLRWRRFASLGEDFAGWLDRCIAPMPEDRFPTANQALADFRRRFVESPTEHRAPTRDELVDAATELNTPQRAMVVHEGRPVGCRIDVRRRGEALEVYPEPRPKTHPAFLAALGVFMVGIAVAYTAVEGFDPIMLGALVLGLVGSFVAYFGRNDVHRFEFSPAGITLHFEKNDTIQRVPQARISGVSNSYGDNQYNLVVHTRDDKTHILAASRRQGDIVWLESILRKWLVEHRM